MRTHAAPAQMKIYNSTTTAPDILSVFRPECGLGHKLLSESDRVRENNYWAEPTYILSVQFSPCEKALFYIGYTVF